MQMHNVPPQPNPHPISHDDGNRARNLPDPHKVRRYHSGQTRSHGYHTRNGKPRGSDRDEHARPQTLLGQFLRHQPVQECRVYHQRDHEPDPLQREAADYDLQRSVASYA